MLQDPRIDKRFSFLLAQKFAASSAEADLVGAAKRWFEAHAADTAPHILDFWRRLLDKPTDEIVSTLLADTPNGAFARETLPPILKTTPRERADMLQQARAAK